MGTTSTAILSATAAAATAAVFSTTSTAELCSESPVFPTTSTAAATSFQDPSACWTQPRPVSASVQPATAPAVPGAVSEVSVGRADLSFKIIIYKIKYIYFE